MNRRKFFGVAGALGAAAAAPVGLAGACPEPEHPVIPGYEYVHEFVGTDGQRRRCYRRTIGEENVPVLDPETFIPYRSFGAAIVIYSVYVLDNGVIHSLPKCLAGGQQLLCYNPETPEDVKMIPTTSQAKWTRPGSDIKLVSDKDGCTVVSSDSTRVEVPSSLISPEDVPEYLRSIAKKFAQGQT